MKKKIVKCIDCEKEFETSRADRCPKCSRKLSNRRYLDQFKGVYKEVGIENSNKEIFNK